MSQYLWIENVKENETYRESFFELAKLVFELDFRAWYDNGGWNDQYVCYSYADQGKVIANASINKMTLVSDGRIYQAIQIGTVMTHPDYRNQGLSGKLMQRILDIYENKCDFIYLFANDTVHDFYPKFGFQRVAESSFSLQVTSLGQLPAPSGPIRRLDLQHAEDQELLQSMAASRVPVSNKLGVIRDEHLLTFYSTLAFPDDFYYFEKLEAIVLFKHEESELHLFDIVSRTSIDIESIVASLINEETKIVHFHFTPDVEWKELRVEPLDGEDDALFVKPGLPWPSNPFLFPVTSHA
ncbi:GNAT family N-acetyltransferase [Paenibacillus sp. NPDC057967]|uniref:GNAT family N-acetyltransferase n=1 Tax=Paenibacillus sp. NPDC057967 TaxID=3346293 RepID=UPI0036D819AF